MAGETFPLKQLQIIVGKSDQVEDGFAIVPVKTCGVDVTMDEAVVVHVGDCACDLAEDKEEAWR